MIAHVEPEAFRVHLVTEGFCPTCLQHLTLSALHPSWARCDECHLFLRYNPDEHNDDVQRRVIPR